MALAKDEALDGVESPVPASGSVNPYLGMAAFIAAGLDGIRRKLDPGEPNVRKNMYTLTLDEVKRGKIGLIPQSLTEAITCFEEDAVVQQALGPSCPRSSSR